MGSLTTLSGIIEKITAHASDGHFQATLYSSLSSGQGQHIAQLQVSYFDSHGEEISLTWFDIGEPLLIHSQPNQIPDRRYGVCTVLIPALGTRLVRNGVEAKGRSWPREREGRPFSTSALAFSESWTEAI